MPMSARPKKGVRMRRTTLFLASVSSAAFLSPLAFASSSSPPSSLPGGSPEPCKRPLLRLPPPKFLGPEGFFRRWTVTVEKAASSASAKRRKRRKKRSNRQQSATIIDVADAESDSGDEDYPLAVDATSRSEEVESCDSPVEECPVSEEEMDTANAVRQLHESLRDGDCAEVPGDSSLVDASTGNELSQIAPRTTEAREILVGNYPTAAVPPDRDMPGIASIVDVPSSQTASSAPAASALSLLLRQYFPPERIIRMSLTAAQLGIAWYLCKAVWEALAESLEELSQMDSDGGGGPATQEEHDRPYLSEEGVDAATGLAPQDDTDSHGVGRKRRAATVASAAASSDLARRLLASGMPMDLDCPPPSGSVVSPPPTVRHVLKSLTRTEGRLLSNALLSPIDSGSDAAANVVGGDTESVERKQKRISKMWNDIGGLDHVKEALLDLVFPMLMLKQRTTDIADDASTAVTVGTESSSSYFGGLLSNPPGVLLYGPPGCGKTTLVRALASTANARVLVVTPSTLLRKYVGETELQVRALFSLARKIAPTIIFVDELDGIFRDRGQGGNGSGGGGGEHEVNRDLKTEFMQLWDGVISQSDSCGVAGHGHNVAPQVLVIGATNRPFDVDPGFLRRMPRSFYVGPPDFFGRCAVLRSMLSDVPLSPDFDLEAVSRATEGYTPSDIKEVLRTAALSPLREARRRATEQVESIRRAKESGEELPDFGGIPPLRPLTTDDVLRARAAVAPTHLGSGYRSALADYATRAGIGTSTGGYGSSSGYLRGQASEYDGDQPRAYQHPHGYAVHKAVDGTFYADVGTATPLGMHPPEFFNANPENGSFEEDSESECDFAYDSDVDSESETSASSASSSYEDDDI